MTRTAPILLLATAVAGCAETTVLMPDAGVAIVEDANLGPICPAAPACLEHRRAVVAVPTEWFEWQLRTLLLFEGPAMLVEAGVNPEGTQLHWLTVDGETPEPAADIALLATLGNQFPASAGGVSPRVAWWEPIPRTDRWQLVETHPEAPASAGVVAPDRGASAATVAPSVMADGSWFAEQGQLVFAPSGGGALETFPIDGTPWGRLAASRAGSTDFVLWHDLDARDYARAWVTREDGTTALVMTSLAMEGSIVADGETVWVAGFERTPGSLTDSRVRIAHLRGDTLERVEPDRSWFGWGGLRPVGLQLLMLEGRTWLVMLTGDSRYGSASVLYAEPLSDSACQTMVAAPRTVIGGDGTGFGIRSFVAASRSESLLAAHEGADGIWIHTLEPCP